MGHICLCPGLEFAPHHVGRRALQEDGEGHGWAAGVGGGPWDLSLLTGPQPVPALSLTSLEEKTEAAVPPEVRGADMNS